MKPRLSWLSVRITGLVWLAVAGLAGPARAVAPSGLVAAEFFAGAGGQQTRSVLAVGDLAFAGGDVLAGGMRFDDTIVGPGYGVVGGGGLRLGGAATLRVLGTRFVGDEGYRAWRVKVGPQWQTGEGSMLGLSYTLDSNNLGPSTGGGSCELNVPVASGWTGRLNGSYGRTETNDGFAASVGAGWVILPRLELTGDVGVARNPPATTAGPSPRGGLGSILDPVGPGPSPEPRAISAITSLGLRLSLP